jgi:hypothetical protein
MYLFRPLGSALIFLVVCGSALAQQPNPARALGRPQALQAAPGQSSSPIPVQDPQAVSVLTQTIAAAGGSTILGGIQNFSGTGSISYLQPSNVQGSVTLSGTNMDQFRQDTTLPSGVLSQVVANDQITLEMQNGTVLPLNIQAPLCPERLIVPYMFLVPAMNGSGFSISYKGLMPFDSGTAYEIELQEVVPGLADPAGQFAQYHTIDFFIDSSSFQILMMQDVVPTNLVRQIRFSNYTNLNGVLIPFSITQQVDGLQVWTIQLSQISFNTALPASTFQL